MICNGVIEHEKLQPGDEAAKCHGFRAHLQVVEWKMLDQRFNLSPTEWDWKEMITSQNKKCLTPVRTSKAAAPENLLIVIRCRCKERKTNVVQTSVHVENMASSVWLHVAGVTEKAVITKW